MLTALFEHYPELSCCKESVETAIEKLCESFLHSGKLLLCGNGGSYADCEHISGEFMKGFLLKRPLTEVQKADLAARFGNDGIYLGDKLQGGLAAFALPSQNSVITAFNNDVAADLAYAQLAWASGNPGDVLMGISTSGNSRNVVYACMAARARGMVTIGMAGRRICKLDEVCDVVIHVPACETYRVQEYHLPVYHAICAEIENHFFG